MLVGVAIPIEFTAGAIGRPLPLWFRITAIVGVSAVGLALTVNLVYELVHRSGDRIGHLRQN